MSFPATPPALALAKTQAKRWKIHPPLPAEVGRALSQFSPILQQLLYNRGYTEPEQAHIFIEGAMPSDTDPMQMLGVPQAVERVRRAIQNGEKIAIYGDYDTDGVTATVLLVQTLEKLGGTVMGYIPDRFDEGYGLNKEALTKLHPPLVPMPFGFDTTHPWSLHPRRRSRSVISSRLSAALTSSSAGGPSPSRGTARHTPRRAGPLRAAPGSRGRSARRPRPRAAPTPARTATAAP